MRKYLILAVALVAAGAFFALARPASAQAGQERRIVIGPMEGQGAYLGVELRDVKGDEVASLKLPAERGAVVAVVSSGSPAEQAGLKANDVIVEFDGQPVHSAAQLARLVRETPAGRSVEVAVYRNGQKNNLNAKLGEREHEREFPKAFAKVFPEGRNLFEFEGPHIGADVIKDRIMQLPMRRPARLGIEIQPLSDQMAEFLKVPGKAGVLVSSVNESSPAQKAGLRAGDVIVGVNGKTVADIEDLSQSLGSSESEKVALDYVRNGQKASATVTLEAPAQKKRTQGFKM
ncbi:MAG: PDZ domain-containing protein [Acidobacteriota bacterium]